MSSPDNAGLALRSPRLAEGGWQPAAPHGQAGLLAGPLGASLSGALAGTAHAGLIIVIRVQIDGVGLHTLPAWTVLIARQEEASW